jgi:hypothetical protein
MRLSALYLGDPGPYANQQLAQALRVALDPVQYPNATIPIDTAAGARRIDTVTYLAIRALGFQKSAQGQWLMCLKVCTKPARCGTATPALPSDRSGGSELWA